MLFKDIQRFAGQGLRAEMHKGAVFSVDYPAPAPRGDAPGRSARRKLRVEAPGGSAGTKPGDEVPGGSAETKPRAGRKRRDEASREVWRPVAELITEVEARFQKLLFGTF